MFEMSKKAIKNAKKNNKKLVKQPLRSKLKQRKATSNIVTINCNAVISSFQKQNS